MGDETKVDVYKRLTLDLLGSMPGSWRSFEYICDDFRESDGDVDEPALRTAVGELLEEGKIQWDERHWETTYRIATPQEGESLAEKLRRLEAENERLRGLLDGDRREIAALVERQREPAPSDSAAAERSVAMGQDEGVWFVSVQSTPDHFIVIHHGKTEHDADVVADGVRNVIERILTDHVAQLRAEQAADRAAVMALVDALPKCWSPGCGQPATTVYPPHDDESCDTHDVAGRSRAHDNWYAAQLRALQARVATWPSDAGAGDDAQAGSLGLTFEEAARRYPEAWSRARALVDGSAYWKAEPIPYDEPPVHATSEGVERASKAWDVVQSVVDAGLIGPSKVGGTYAERLGTPKGCLCTWVTNASNPSTPSLIRRAPGQMPCPVHDYVTRSVRFTCTIPVDVERDRDLMRPVGGERPGQRQEARYIGEFGDIDEPSVGDVDGYGVRK